MCRRHEFPALLHEIQSLAIRTSEDVIARKHCSMVSQLVDTSRQLLVNSWECVKEHGDWAGLLNGAVEGCRAALAVSRQAVGMVGACSREYHVLDGGKVVERLLERRYVRVTDVGGEEGDTIVFASPHAVPSYAAGVCDDCDREKCRLLLCTAYGAAGRHADSEGHVIRVRLAGGIGTREGDHAKGGGRRRGGCLVLEGLKEYVEGLDEEGLLVLSACQSFSTGHEGKLFEAAVNVTNSQPCVRIRYSNSPSPSLSLLRLSCFQAAVPESMLSRVSRP